MIPIEVYKPLGLISVVVTCVAVGFLVYKFRGHKGMSISKHAAAFRQAYLMMAAIETVVLPMFFLFVWKWFVPTFHLPTLFTIYVGMAASGLLIAAWIPDVRGWKGVVHAFCAYGAAILFIPATTVLSLSPEISSFSKFMVFTAFAYQIISFSLFVSTQKAKEYHLYVQVAYILLFHGSILIAAYVR